MVGGRSSARLEPQIVDLAVAGSNPVGHPKFSTSAVLAPNASACTTARNRVSVRMEGASMGAVAAISRACCLKQEITFMAGALEQVAGAQAKRNWVMAPARAQPGTAAIGRSGRGQTVDTAEEVVKGQGAGPGGRSRAKAR